MKTTQMTVTFDTEKLEALRQYAAKKDVSIEGELTEAISRMYEKLVPAPVREYIESKPESELPARPVRPPRPRPDSAKPDGGQ